MQKLILWLVCTLGILLPFHGVITVFLPEPFRFWKEGILIFLLGVVIFLELQRIFVVKPLSSFKNLSVLVKKIGFPLLKRGEETGEFKFSETLALLFLIWGGGLVLVSSDFQTAGMAFRYLGMGFVVFLILSRLLAHFGEKWGKEVFQKFSWCFIGSCVASVLFGTWAEYLGGFDILAQFYSTTISSWVPGQTLPLYHEVDGAVRMQGGSSGPVAFAHLLLVAVFLLFLNGRRQFSIFNFQFSNNFQYAIFNSQKNFLLFLTSYFLLLVLVFGIYESASRAAVLGLVAGGLIWLFFHYRSKVWKVAIITIVFIGLGFVGQKIYDKVVHRAGTLDHFTRPVEAFQKGLESPVFGSLGELGPAARAKNLRENDDDQALIAENVFVDYFAQMGIFGILLAIGFFISLFWKSKKEWWPFVGGFLVVVNLATIFDMVPVGMVFFLMLAFLEYFKEVELR